MPWLYVPFFSGLSELQMDLLSSKDLSRELPQTDCQKLAPSDSGPKSGARSEGLQSEAERQQRASSLTVDQRWVGGQSVQLVGMRRAQNAVGRWAHTPVTSILRKVAHTVSYFHTHIYNCVHMTLVLHISYPEIKCYSVKYTFKMSALSGSYRPTLTAMQRF